MENEENKKPKIVESKIVFKGYFDVIEDRILLPPEFKKEYKYFKLEEGEAVSIISETKKGEFILLNEYRHPTGKFILGFPGGIVDKNEDILEASKRELLEETGYSSDLKNFKILGTTYQSPALSGLKIHHIYVSDCELVSKQSLESSEILQVQIVSKKELYKSIENNSNIDGCILTSLFFYEKLK